jgi:hypothetical protein
MAIKLTMLLCVPHIACIFLSACVFLSIYVLLSSLSHPRISRIIRLYSYSYFPSSFNLIDSVVLSTNTESIYALFRSIFNQSVPQWAAIRKNGQKSMFEFESREMFLIKIMYNGLQLQPLFPFRAHKGTDSADKSLLSSDSMHKVDPSEV